MKDKTLEEYLPLLQTYAPIPFKLYVRSVNGELRIELCPPGGEPWCFKVSGDTLTYIPDSKE